MIRNNGRLYQDQSANSDGSRCGQAFNGSAYGGVSNPIYGTLTVGRQQSLELDSVSSYDPMGLAPAFALLGYSGGTAGGIGSTETARWDNSVKYVFSYGLSPCSSHVYGRWTGHSYLQRCVWVQRGSDLERLFRRRYLYQGEGNGGFDGYPQSALHNRHKLPAWSVARMVFSGPSRTMRLRQ